MQKQKENFITLKENEARIVLKVLQTANMMYTVIEMDYHENNIDPIITSLKAQIDSFLDD